MKREVSAHIAVLLGRFQPPTIAHAATVQCILTQWHKIIIGIVYHSPPPDDFEYEKWGYTLNESSFDAIRNPFTPEEVHEMWKGYINSCNAADRISCQLTKRPHFTQQFNTIYPPDTTDIVCIRAPKGDPDYGRQYTIFQKMFNRNVYFIDPPSPLHNTDIKRIIKLRHRSWQEYIPVGAYEVFVQINGHARVSLCD